MLASAAYIIHHMYLPLSFQKSFHCSNNIGGMLLRTRYLVAESLSETKVYATVITDSLARLGADIKLLTGVAHRFAIALNKLKDLVKHRHDYNCLEAAEQARAVKPKGAGLSEKNMGWLKEARQHYDRKTEFLNLMQDEMVLASATKKVTNEGDRKKTVYQLQTKEQLQTCTIISSENRHGKIKKMV
ncbi:hypothetical protein PTNB85_00007 [Pyrenophora teres f. teres]|nr:hypothetical protein PTNB85_00007 [Pyrenophora teres f. teres]